MRQLASFSHTQSGRDKRFAFSRVPLFVNEDISKPFLPDNLFLYKLKGFFAKNTTFASLGKLLWCFIMAVMSESVRYPRITFLPRARSTRVSFYYAIRLAREKTKDVTSQKSFPGSGSQTLYSAKPSDGRKYVGKTK